METVLSHKLNNGTVSVLREIKDGDELIHFAAVIDTQHPAKTIFDQVTQGFIDSKKSWIWPIEYENVPEPLDFDLYEGCQFRMGYSVPRWDDPTKTMPEVIYTYDLKQFRPDEFLFEYQSVDHALSGGGTFRAIPTGDGTSRFDWRGTYKSKPGNEKILDSLKKYLPVLYEIFERRIEAGPS